jgi:hypothetical protein
VGDDHAVPELLTQLLLELALAQGAAEVEDASLVLELDLDAEIVGHRR